MLTDNPKHRKAKYSYIFWEKPLYVTARETIETLGAAALNDWLSTWCKFYNT